MNKYIILAIAIIATGLLLPFIIMLVRWFAKTFSELAAQMGAGFSDMISAYITEWKKIIYVLSGKHFARKREIKRIVKKLNRVLNIKLKQWQIDFIFNSAPIPRKVRENRCNGKTLAHILRLCLKASNIKIKEPIYLRVMTDNGVNRMCFPVLEFLGDDIMPTHRQENFYFELRGMYKKLAATGEFELREICRYKRNDIVF